MDLEQVQVMNKTCIVVTQIMFQIGYKDIIYSDKNVLIV
jgi:hypothetical protein